MAGTTGLEPATSAVTGQRSNQTELRPQKCDLVIGIGAIEARTTDMGSASIIAVPLPIASWPGCVLLSQHD
jgi:hypothetical protein